MFTYEHVPHEAKSTVLYPEVNDWKHECMLFGDHALSLLPFLSSAVPTSRHERCTGVLIISAQLSRRGLKETC